MIVCLDSHIIVWGIKEEATPGQENMIPKAKLFFAWLDEQKHDVIIPSVVVGELLMRVPATEHEKVTQFFEKRFRVPSFDLMCASKYAEIWQKRNEDKTIDFLKKKMNATREEIKADCQIVAIAIVQKAQCIYSYDDKLKKFAEGFIEVRQMPHLIDPASQLQLSYEEKDIKLLNSPSEPNEESKEEKQI
jgi:hypothetical protein